MENCKYFSELMPIIVIKIVYKDNKFLTDINFETTKFRVQIKKIKN
jgi:hypothetical protein